MSCFGASYYDWTGVFQLKSSRGFPIFPLCRNPYSHVSALRTAYLAVRLSEWSGCSFLHSSGCEMSPFNMLMSWVPVVPLGESLTRPDRCVCVCACVCVCVYLQHSWWQIYFVCMHTLIDKYRPHANVQTNVCTCAIATSARSLVWAYAHPPRPMSSLSVCPSYDWPWESGVCGDEEMGWINCLGVSGREVFSTLSVCWTLYN